MSTRASPSFNHFSSEAGCVQISRRYAIFCRRLCTRHTKIVRHRAWLKLVPEGWGLPDIAFVCPLSVLCLFCAACSCSSVPLRHASKAGLNEIDCVPMKAARMAPSLLPCFLAPTPAACLVPPHSVHAAITVCV